MMTRHLFVTDLDGTLLDADSSISPRSRRILNELIAHGVAVTAATARTPATVMPIFAAVTPSDTPMVVMTGAALWNRRTRCYTDLRPFDREAAAGILAAIRACGVEPLVYTRHPADPGMLHVYYRDTVNDATRSFVRERLDSDMKAFHLNEQPPVDSDTLLFYANGPVEQVFAAADALRSLGGCSVSAFTDIFGPETGILEVFAPGVDKASAILRLKEHLGATHLTVYGDNLNDIPMMAVADDAVAVANALPEVKAAANRVIGYNTADAVALDIAARFPDIITPDLLKK
ncbi:MAG: Cof-type HAD-IIB family hydrolase [Candidatus Amulumruptor caecigallinarius]|nr:Cof-type HAD-IIB family hydrolase [Candidatus Amulumruptor caecigallinarius]MCM1396417.1 Cof-type HAD-IIB family hydrolase [Candidatus Amulumruptor caecigallinarius]MCM1453526.1 Cof-type HAD-IIB family hydrolase [bacterium]